MREGRATFKNRFPCLGNETGSVPPDRSSDADAENPQQKQKNQPPSGEGRPIPNCQTEMIVKEEHVVHWNNEVKRVPKVTNDK